MSENYERSWDSLKPLKTTWSMAEFKGLKPDAPTLGQDQIPVVQTGQPKLINTWRGRSVNLEAIDAAGNCIVSEVEYSGHHYSKPAEDDPQPDHIIKAE